jgi:hypothetical protein
MLVLGAFVVAAVLSLLLVAFVGLNLRRVMRWARGEPQPEAGWQELRNSAASAVWKQYQTRYKKDSSSEGKPLADVEDVDFRETPRASTHPSDNAKIGRLPS